MRLSEVYHRARLLVGWVCHIQFDNTVIVGQKWHKMQIHFMCAAAGPSPQCGSHSNCTVSSFRVSLPLSLKPQACSCQAGMLLQLSCNRVWLIEWEIVALAQTAQQHATVYSHITDITLKQKLTSDREGPAHCIWQVLSNSIFHAGYQGSKMQLNFQIGPAAGLESDILRQRLVPSGMHQAPLTPKLD